MDHTAALTSILLPSKEDGKSLNIVIGIFRMKSEPLKLKVGPNRVTFRKEQSPKMRHVSATPEI